MYKLKKLNNTNKDFEILNEFLIRMDSIFIPPLHCQVDINEYSKKLIKLAENYIVIDKNNCIGLVAFYINNQLPKEVFITCIGVLPSYQGNNIASSLLSYVNELSERIGMERVRLEVNAGNKRAISFYFKKGFQISAKTDKNSFYMERSIM